MFACATPARAWDDDGHVIITRIAHASLPDTMPAWLRADAVRLRLEYLSGEPDRWRGQDNLHLDHVNKPEHYIDEEMLHPYGLSLRNLPPLRRQYLDRLATYRAEHPDTVPYTPDGDNDYTRLCPGLLPYRIAELQWTIAASWTALKTYEQFPDQTPQWMIDNARKNIVFHMGVLSHYVGDGAQPLHVTIHHHGWEGDNPMEYTRDRGFHSYIDGGILRRHHINADDLLPRAKKPRPISAERYWLDTCAYLMETFERVEPLYALEKSGELNEETGKRFIEDRMLTGGAALAGYWVAAYKGAAIDDYRVRELKRKAKRKAAATQPAMAQ